MKISIAQLAEGEHEYAFDFLRSDVELDDSYGYDYPIHLEVRLTKMGDEYLVQGEVTTRANLVCDRCAEPFVAEIRDRMLILYTLSGKVIPPEEEKRYDEIRRIEPSDLEIDIGDDVRQTLILAIPWKRLCSPECRGLCPRCGANLNVEPCRCPEPVVDPRWESLKKLMERG
ncbi:MAG: DUF177 domain-containing protein [candidate division KSB1 bacterium]|nr:DUF177 domain-containing protein [candidate division KSB1 bacterium]